MTVTAGAAGSGAGGGSGDDSSGGGGGRVASSGSFGNLPNGGTSGVTDSSFAYPGDWQAEKIKLVANSSEQSADFLIGSSIFIVSTLQLCRKRPLGRRGAD